MIDKAGVISFIPGSSRPTVIDNVNNAFKGSICAGAVANNTTGVIAVVNCCELGSIVMSPSVDSKWISVVNFTSAAEAFDIANVPVRAEAWVNLVLPI